MSAPDFEQLFYDIIQHSTEERGVELLQQLYARSQSDAFKESAKLVLSDEGEGDIDFIAMLLRERAKGGAKSKGCPHD